MVSAAQLYYGFKAWAPMITHLQKHATAAYTEVSPCRQSSLMLCQRCCKLPQTSGSTHRGVPGGRPYQASCSLHDKRLKGWSVCEGMSTPWHTLDAHRCREAALQLLHSALAQTSDPHPSGTELQTAAGPVQAAVVPHPDGGATLHGLLAQLLQATPTTASVQEQQTQSLSALTPTAPNLSLHQQVLQGAQTQHRALHWLLKICAELALGVSKLLPGSSQLAPSADDANGAAPGGRWVLLGALLGVLDGYTQQLIFSIEDVVPSRHHRLWLLPKMVKNVLLNFTTVADAVGPAQR